MKTINNLQAHRNSSSHCLLKLSTSLNFRLKCQLKLQAVLPSNLCRNRAFSPSQRTNDAYSTKYLERHTQHAAGERGFREMTSRNVLDPFYSHSMSFSKHARYDRQLAYSTSGSWPQSTIVIGCDNKHAPTWHKDGRKQRINQRTLVGGVPLTSSIFWSTS
jgi:hypothetical protein